MADTALLSEFTASIGSYAVDMVYAGQVQHVYHYTDLPALRGTIEGQDRWLTHSKYSNDDEVLDHGRRVAVETLEAELNAGKGSGREAFVRSVLDRVRAPQLEGVYVCCFCTEDDLLSQWRAYGANGTGVSIKLRVADFNVVTGPDSPADGLVRLWKVFYDDGVKRQIVSFRQACKK
jgi:hypothetical protein